MGKGTTFGATRCCGGHAAAPSGCPALQGNVLRQGCAPLLGKMFTVRGSVLSGELPVSRHRAGRASLRHGTAWSSERTALLPADGAANPGGGGAPHVERHSPRNGMAEHPGRSPLCARCLGIAEPGRAEGPSGCCHPTAARAVGPDDAPDPWGDV